MKPTNTMDTDPRNDDPIPLTSPPGFPDGRAALAALRRDRSLGIELGLALALLGLVAFSFADTFGRLVHRWNTDANYSHGFLVPLVSLYLAWQAIQAAPPRSIAGGQWLGALLIAFGFVCHAITSLLASLILDCISLLLILAGMTLFLGGWAWFVRMAAPLAFLIFMVPWPSALYSRLALPLQLFASQVAAVVLQLVGIPVLRDGNLLHLPKQTMHVAEACSGLRQLTAFLAISTCAALLVHRPWWYRVTLLASAVPIAVLVNSLRVTFTGLLLQWGDPSWIQGTLHTLEGLVMVGVGLGFLLAEMKLLDWILDDVPRSESGPPSPSIDDHRSWTQREGVGLA